MESLDEIMQRATLAIENMDYLSCEADCLMALGAARAADDWAYYGRVLMPLQEARRQRRMIAAEGTIRLGTSDLDGPITALSDRIASGCIVVTHPFTASDVLQLQQKVRADRRHIEVLYADNAAAANRWTLRGFAGPDVHCLIDAPAKAWIDRWFSPTDIEVAPPPRPSGWFIDATEAIGDLAVSQVDSPLGTPQRVAALESRLAVMTDHEILHQRLWEAARALCTAKVG